MRGCTSVRFCGVAFVIVACLLTGGRVLAQGPAGAGAAEAAGGGSNSRSYNPAKWFGKKDSKAASGGLTVEELDKKLEPKLRAAQLLGADASLTSACRNFVERIDCVAALYASHNLGSTLECIRSNASVVRTRVAAASCRTRDTDQPLSLVKTIRWLKPNADANTAPKEAETAAKQAVKEATS